MSMTRQEVEQLVNNASFRNRSKWDSYDTVTKAAICLVQNALHDNHLRDINEKRLNELTDDWAFIIRHCLETE